MGADYHPAPIKYMFQHQPDVVLDQAAPVQNTWYTVLATTLDVRILSIGAVIRIADETVEGELTIDGNTVLVYPSAFTFDTIYEVANQNPIDPRLNFIQPLCHYRGILIEGQSIRFRIRKTTVAGAGNLYCRVKYALLVPT